MPSRTTASQQNHLQINDLRVVLHLGDVTGDGLVCFWDETTPKLQKLNNH